MSKDLPIKSNLSHTEFKIFFEKNYKQFVIQATRLVQEVNLAEDIVQECFVKFWEKADSLKIRTSNEAYLSRMVRNKCLDHLRSSGKISFLESEEIPELSFEETQELEISDLKKTINKNIDMLPERCRQIFVLSRFEKLSYKEIAEELNLSTKTVENQISKALKQMRIGLKGFLSMVF